MKKIFAACIFLFAGYSVVNAQELSVKPTKFDKGKKVTFTFSGTDGMVFTQGTPSINKLFPLMYILYTSASPTQGTHTTNWPNQGTSTSNWFFSDSYDYDWIIYQGTNTQGTNSQGTNSQGSPTQGTNTYCSFCMGTNSLKSGGCMPEYDGFLSPLNITMIDSETITAEFDFPSYLSAESINIIFDNGEPCPYIMSNSIVMLGTDKEEVASAGVPVVSVYPNPFAAELHFDFDQLYSGLNYDIYSITGTYHTKGQFQVSEEIVDLSHLPNGTYVVTVLLGNKVVKSDKFLKR